MQTKSEKTSQFIIEKVAPYFIRYGYAGTSMSDLTQATGLTKGAIYGNFENKEALAVKAFSYNVRNRIGKLIEAVEAEETALRKLRCLTDFYRNYYEMMLQTGGCPILNVGVDSERDSILSRRVTEIIGKLTSGIARVIELGKEEGTLKKELDAQTEAGLVFAQIQGAVYMAEILNDGKCLVRMMDHLDWVIANKWMN